MSSNAVCNSLLSDAVRSATAATATRSLRPPDRLIGLLLEEHQLVRVAGLWAVLAQLLFRAVMLVGRAAAHI
jgi:hypothetical protein